MSDMHSFSVDVAKEVGVNAAILLQSIKWWCDKNRANGKHLHNGLWWTYNSVKAWEELYPYLGKSAINSALSKLEERGYIAVGNYNKSAYDRTKWYAITEDGMSLFGESICRNREMEDSEIVNPTLDFGEPIPVAEQLHPQLQKRCFVEPTLEEVEAYCAERNNGIDARHFIDYNKARGWKLKGGLQMKDWKAAVRTWERVDAKGGEEHGDIREYLQGYDFGGSEVGGGSEEVHGGGAEGGPAQRRLPLREDWQG